MKSITSKIMALLFICTTLFAFTAKPGGESFEIYLNNKLVLQRFGNKIDDIKSLSLNHSISNQKISVKYNHCGRVAKNRQITIRNAKNRILSILKYPDASSPMSGMEINVKDLLNLKNVNGNTLTLYYSSTQLVKGRELVHLLIPDISK